MRVCSSCGEENSDKAKFCSECASALTEAETPRETRKTVTVLFADMSGSTALGERLDPEALRVVIERYFDAMKAEIERHGGLVEKFIGDAVMAVFGIPRAHEDDALRAVRAAMGLHRVLAELNVDLVRDHGVEIRVRVGINTGEVVTGDSTERQRLVTGDTVNVAARFEQAATPGEVLIGRSTYRLVRDAVEVEDMAPLELKGKSELIPAFRVVRIVEGAAPIARRADTAFVGRERERELLADALARVQGDRSCHLFTLLGTAGVGKSRLVAEVLGTGSADNVQVLSGRCLPYGDGITFWPVLEIVKSAAGITESDDIEALRSKLQTTLEGEEDATAIEATLAAMLGLVPGGGALEETFWGVRRFLESLARDRPLVVVVDDLHWSAPPLLDLIEHVLHWSRDVPLLLLCLARPEFLDERPGWGGGKMNATTILLEPFDERDSSMLVENLLETADLPSELTDRVVRAAEGNPLFVEELLAMLVDDGSLVRDDGRWRQTASLSELTLPSSIQALLAARLDQLEPSELRVIEGGAVVGQVFYRAALAELAPEALAPDVGTYLKSLMRKDLVRPEGGGFPGDETYRFRHILIRDAAYRSMPKRTRAEMHERFADWLERTAGERLHEFEEIVGHHLEQAYRYRTELGEEAMVLANRAHRHLRGAGSRASDRGDVQSAIRLLNSAVMIGTPVERAEAHLELNIAHDLAGDRRAALAALEEARSLDDDGDGSSVALRAELRTIRLNRSLDPSVESYGRSAARIRSIIAELEPLDDVLGLADAWEALGMAEWGSARFDEAAQAFRTSIGYARRTQDPRAVRSPSFAHCVAMTMGSVRLAEARAEARETYDAFGSGPASEAFTTTIEADFASMEGKFEEARRLAARSMVIAEDLALNIVVEGILQTQALIERRVGDLEALAEPARRWYGMTSEAGDVGVGSTAAALLAEALLGLDQLSEAGRLATVAIDTSADDDFASQVGGRRVLALIAARRGDERSARSLIEEAVDRCEGVQWPEEVGNTHLDRAEVMRLLGEEEEAIMSARRALELYAAKGIRPLEERAAALLASLAVS